MLTQDKIDTLAKQASELNVFGPVSVDGAVLTCEAWGAAEPAFYRVRFNDQGATVELATENRWLSESIEAELVESGDKLEELITDELVDLGYEPSDSGNDVRFEHFRSDDMEFLFRSKVVVMEGQDELDACLLWLRAYEQCFRQLGDMDESGEDD